MLEEEIALLREQLAAATGQPRRSPPTRRVSRVHGVGGGVAGGGSGGSGTSDSGAGSSHNGDSDSQSDDGEGGGASGSDISPESRLTQLTQLMASLQTPWAEKVR